MKERVVIAMSGGVDSSTAAAILKDEGYDVVGISMQIWDYSAEKSERFGTCCSLNDINDARRVAEMLGIPFYVLNLEEEFKRNVVEYFISEYMKGRTPNPCIPCNQSLKFDALLTYAMKIGASRVATGHYARVVKEGERYFIVRGIDREKDQSYFLFSLTQEQLKRAIFPLGDYTKSEIRKIAKSLRLRVAEKEESQEICFIPDNNYGEFIRKRIDTDKIKEGEIVMTDGKVVGRHTGLPFYTIGQRKGLGVGWQRPLYVSEIDIDNNRLIVGESNTVIKKGAVVENVNWSISEPRTQSSELRTSIRASVQIRYRHIASDAEIKLNRNNAVNVIFDKPQRAITPGQAAVFYHGERLIGGGWIKKVIDE
ncbi:MAG: tRNA 2-thiouridine(34) synthase MnmA [Nitrospinae bacterium RIFCSPLOWO2_02_FULL_39_110]|nr:MAG: tRNA 2-thiouridine(34) synthase MnmA [Nitrospinae bacterium RIFCSPHIGHO2_02_39_11]OGV99438.1 MAG: tRNA 2-thiouridine(34) synthase MnmA [Nitrospinae bacterium RIFCSPHIGHO2_12_FULL_39_42]OGW01404.1 MAG: tRNA 2-thiouridine(34) synthase MnmA [Nitrospinae bacterium RIFCSPHIGHO2_02_FULL_39_82]OGW03868.1 MAG: tRNA 2-thiouridine(34) synthase MnmA [Nitrospinae bacterium RIFCSPLOWO2_02_FULL_39_110]OGW06945.1 MAG: tRNA 2-thiouridine(34) synthase MnmA [Nitrospinae bacterium RIFCSPLOWO2_02_39_17]OG